MDVRAMAHIQNFENIQKINNKLLSMPYLIPMQIPQNK